MMDVGRHPNIELYAYSEVESISGYIGNFKARIKKKVRFVVEQECTACGDCVEVCPVVSHDEYELGLASRRAIYLPFPQAVPAAYLIDKEKCLGMDPIACGKCASACEKGCIDYDMKDEYVDLDVGAVIVATGAHVFEPSSLEEYGYRRYPNVITSLEFERLVNAGGPTEGEIVRFTDLQTPKKIAFIQCVGSRSVRSRTNDLMECSRGRGLHTTKTNIPACVIGKGVEAIGYTQFEDIIDPRTTTQHAARFKVYKIIIIKRYKPSCYRVLSWTLRVKA